MSADVPVEELPEGSAVHEDPPPYRDEAQHRRYRGLHRVPPATHRVCGHVQVSTIVLSEHLTEK